MNAYLDLISNELGRFPMRAIPLLLTVLVVGCMSEDIPRQTAVVTELSMEQMIEDLHQYHEIVTQGWAYLGSEESLRVRDLAAVRDRLISSVSEETTKAQFADMLKVFAAALHDGHSTADTTHLKVPPPNTWPIGFLAVREGIVVGNLNWLKDNPDIELGDRLVSVNGQAIEDLVRQQMTVTSASTESARRLLALDQLHWTEETSIRFSIERNSGGMIEVDAPCLLGRVDYRFRERKLFCTTEAVGERIALIRIPQFTWNPLEFHAARTNQDRESVLSEAKQHIDKAFSNLHDADGLILDLRGNSGGFELLSSYVAEHLVEEDFLYYTTTRNDTPLIRSLEAYRGFESHLFGRPIPQHPRRWQGIRHFTGPSFKGRLVVLIDSRCFSTTDNLCAFLRDTRSDTRFLGQPTGAGSGEPMTVASLKNSHVSIQFCVSQVTSPNGTLIEGHGTLPDMIVERSRSDVIERTDAVLEAAIEELQNWQ